MLTTATTVAHNITAPPRAHVPSVQTEKATKSGCKGEVPGVKNTVQGLPTGARVLAQQMLSTQVQYTGMVAVQSCVSRCWR